MAPARDPVSEKQLASKWLRQCHVQPWSVTVTTSLTSTVTSE